MIPEVNVPGHAGGWALLQQQSDHKELVVSCPEYNCREAYGLLLNVTHPQIWDVMKTVLHHVIEVFDHPPFLHLGGDEVDMAAPCWQEYQERKYPDSKSKTHQASMAGLPAKRKRVSRARRYSLDEWYEQIALFEEQLNRVLEEDFHYPPSRIIRWERKRSPKRWYRAGNITQFWFPHAQEGADTEWMVSRGLYLDIVYPDHHSKPAPHLGWFDYGAARKIRQESEQKPPRAIIVGAFELSTDFFVARNVMGRLLSVAMGASHLESLSNKVSYQNEYRAICQKLGWEDRVCQATGAQLVDDEVYRNQWNTGWIKWKKDVCERMTALET